MAKKQMLFKTKGMNQDLSVSAFNPEFSFENMNLRITPNEGNTLLSWTTEIGTKALNILSLTDYAGEDITPAVIQGSVIGQAVINKYLVLFTISKSAPPSSKNKIYRVEVQKTNDVVEGLNVKLLYSGNLNFNEDYPLETHVSYETNTIQKVYWTDYYNQPRYINIVAPESTMRVWNTEHTEQGGIDSFFDFIPAILSNENITIEKIIGSGGVFEPGVIQYCVSYLRKNGAESNIIYTSPLHYLSFNERGASPEEKVNCCFKLSFINVDYTFDFVRVYSIQRTSLNATPIVKHVVDLPIEYTAYHVNELYSSGDTLLLPWVTRDQVYKRLLGIEVEGGRFSISVAPFESFSNDTGFDLVICRYNSVTGTYEQMQTFSELLYDIHEHQPDYEVEHEHSYYVGFQMTDTVIVEEILEGQDLPSDYYLFLGDTEIGNLSTLEDCYFLYYPNERVWRISLDLPVVTEIEGNDMSYIDTGTSGSIMDPTELLYVGGKTIKALTMTSKDSKLFLGNIKEESNSTKALQDYFNSIRGETSHAESYLNRIPITFKQDLNKTLSFKHASGTYSYTNELKQNRREITTFKAGDYYRFGFQLQKKTGEWTEPIFIDDVQDSLYPNTSIFRDYVSLTYAEATIDFYPITQHVPNFDMAEYAKYRKIRPVIVFPSIVDRITLCQGVINPTVFNAEDRIDNSPYAQASWFFRPYVFSSKPTSVAAVGNTTYKVMVDHDKGSYVNANHLDNIYTYDQAVADTGASEVHLGGAGGDIPKKIEIEGARRKYKDPFSSEKFENVEGNTQYFVDQSIVTLNSPDLEFNTEVQSYTTEDLKLRIVGVIPITGLSSSHQIKASAMSLNTPSTSSDNDPSTGEGELPLNVSREVVSLYGGQRLNAEYLWNDVNTRSNNGTVTTSENFYDYMVHPWQKQGTLQMDNRSDDKAASILSTHKVSNRLYSLNTEYLNQENTPKYSSISTAFHLTENSSVVNYRLPKQVAQSSPINYYPNIDKVLYDTSGSRKIVKQIVSGYLRNRHPLSMKYKSTTHAVIAIKANQDSSSTTSIMPKAQIHNPTAGTYNYAGAFNKGMMSGGKGSSTGLTDITFWGDEITYNQSRIELWGHFNYGGKTIPLDFLWLGELYKDIDYNSLFGGKSDAALQNNKWLIGGDEVLLPERSQDMRVTLRWTEGDTYYQRYDCLKTYAFSPEDSNQVVEALSFMCETHVNLDGRYDKNREQEKGFLLSPENFNQVNSVYSQEDNFFISRIISSDVVNTDYPNQVVWTKTKNSGSDVDLWTNITLANNLETEGDKGGIQKLEKFNDQILFFQDKGIGQIVYNPSVQVASTTGVPIELANSKNVEGIRYLSDKVGCSNKYSVISTPKGIYFIDSFDKSIYLFNGQLQNISDTFGFDSWCKNHIDGVDKKWTPSSFDNITTQYDAANQEVYFTSETTSLAFSEKLQCFTSFYDYGSTPYLCNLQGVNLWIRNNGSIWQHRAGNPCEFFGVNKPYWMTLVGNPESQTDKIFTNLEFRACTNASNPNDVCRLPFDYIEAWNEYQHGFANLSQRNGHDMFKHHTSDGNAHLARKFRIWRCDIPRDNAEVNFAEESKQGIFRQNKHPMDRIRNPWVYLKLYKAKAGDGNALNRTEIHDVVMTYFG